MPLLALLPYLTAVQGVQANVILPRVTHEISFQQELENPPDQKPV